ncbi:uncharacterized protein LOC110726916 isoform X2 [Chenopodium quinoa]|uniref:uncharacterized protein LOC110726916 isoform X2 n=1 Tax=Chenopodium quinoa TaxID=63459 RepID=UPI000B7700C7|nr:uncharacterized protein LOC110726916 isoform X2 [Chenopodium quinoa]
MVMDCYLLMTTTLSLRIKEGRSLIWVLTDQSAKHLPAETKLEHDEALLSQEADADYVIEVSGAINSNAAFYSGYQGYDSSNWYNGASVEEMAETGQKHSQ